MSYAQTILVLRDTTAILVVFLISAQDVKNGTAPLLPSSMLPKWKNKKKLKNGPSYRYIPIMHRFFFLLNMKKSNMYIIIMLTPLCLSSKLT